MRGRPFVEKHFFPQFYVRPTDGHVSIHSWVAAYNHQFVITINSKGIFLQVLLLASSARIWISSQLRHRLQVLKNLKRVMVRDGMRVINVFPNKAHKANDAFSCWWNYCTILFDYLLEKIDFPCFWQKCDGPMNGPTDRLKDGPTDGPTDRRTGRPGCRDVRKHLKIEIWLVRLVCMGWIGSRIQIQSAQLWQITIILDSSNYGLRWKVFRRGQKEEQSQKRYMVSGSLCLTSFIKVELPLV